MPKIGQTNPAIPEFLPHSSKDRDALLWSIYLPTIWSQCTGLQGQNPNPNRQQHVDMQASKQGGRGGRGGRDGTDSYQIGGRSMAPDVVNPVAIGLHIQYRNKQSKTLKATQNEKKTLGFILCIVIGEVRGKAEKHLLSRLLVATSACSQTTAVVSATTRRAW